MPLIDTGALGPNSPLTPQENHQVYCGLDSMLTLEIEGEINRLGASQPSIYSFTRGLQAPYLEIMQRGFAVDDLARRAAVRQLLDRREALQRTLNALAGVMWDFRDREGNALNPASPKQMKEFFFGAMRQPEITISQKGVRKVSTNREVLEKLEERSMDCRPLVACVLTMRDIDKQLDVMECKLEPNGRFAAGYNIVGTETGRPSSSTNAFGTGGNAQNIAPNLRFIFVADPGMEMCVIDLEQVEARDVGYFCGCLFNDWDFLNACESGDLHTNNAKRIWPELPWVGEKKVDRKIADQNFYREFSFRDMAKRGSHLSNYMGTAWTAARSLKVPLGIMEEFQWRYCRTRPSGEAPAFPAIARWWQWTAEQLETTQTITTPFGRKRHFFGRPNDDATLREAIAFLPQSTTADRMNLGLWRVWRHMPEVQLLAQTYDSITFQYPRALREQVIPKALGLIRVELFRPDGTSYVVPGEAKVGLNWASASPTNPDGLIKWHPGLQDTRSQRLGLARLAR